VTRAGARPAAGRGERLQRQPQDAPAEQAQPGPQRQGDAAAPDGAAAPFAWQPQVQDAPGQAGQLQDAGVGVVACMRVSSLETVCGPVCPCEEFCAAGDALA